MKTFEDIGFKIPTILLPKQGTDLTKWAVVACDQYTSQPDYWDSVKEFTGDDESTLNIIFPEIYLEDDDKEERIEKINCAMNAYLENGVLVPHEGVLYTERTIEGKARKGLMVALDLEKYDYSKGSQTLIRATEGTIVERLPPRIEVRENAPIESPHIMVLIDDPKKEIIESIASKKDDMEKVYDFELMKESGHLAGYMVPESMTESIVAGLRTLAENDSFHEKYGVPSDKGVLLYAMGDGNHSLATAKAIWEKKKAEVGMDHPSRYALVELVNVHDDQLVFEPIHRVIFNTKKDIKESLQDYFGDDYAYVPMEHRNAMVETVDNQEGDIQKIGLILNNTYGVIEIKNPKSNLPVGSIQIFLDQYMKEGSAETIDYVHGEDVVCALGSEDNNFGIYLPGMDKNDLFKTVILDGALPRKTFSMGEAHEKRFYMECRKIIE